MLRVQRLEQGSLMCTQAAKSETKNPEVKEETPPPPPRKYDYILGNATAWYGKVILAIFVTGLHRKICMIQMI